MANTWYVQIMGEQLGPLSDDDLRDMAAKRQLMPDGLVRKGSSPNWVPAARIRGLFQEATASTVSLSKVVAQPTMPAQASSTNPVAATTSIDEAPLPEFIQQSPPTHGCLITCPDCEKRISRNASLCPNCGHAFFRPSRSVAIALAWTLGGIGIHKFYLRRPGDGVAALLFCWTFIPAIFALIEGFQYLSMDDEAFARKFGAPPPKSNSRHSSTVPQR